MKLVRKLFFYLIIIIAITASTLVIIVVVYKEDIILLLKEEVNKKIKTKLEVDKIDLKLIKGFPNISIDFQGVKFYSAFKDKILLESKNVYFVLNIFDLYNQRIVVERLEIIEAKINIAINKEGARNFDVFVKNDSLNSTIKSLNLNSVLLKNVEISNIDDVKQIKDGYFIESLHGSLNVNEETINVEVLSDFRLTSTNLTQFNWLVNKKISLNAKSSVIGDRIYIHPSTVAIQKVNFSLEGIVGFKNNHTISLAIKSTNLEYNNLISILPRDIRKKLAPYQGEGLISFNSTIEGDLSGKNWPSLKGQLKFSDFNIQHNAIIPPLENINLQGAITIKNLGNLSSARLEIKKLSASIAEKDLEVSMVWEDFVNPKIKGSIKGSFNVPWVISFLELDELPMEDSNGEVYVDILGEVNLLSTYKVKNNNFTGKLLFKNVAIKDLYGLPLDSLNGKVVFNNNKVEVERLGFNYGQSNLLFNGSVKFPENNTKRLYSKLSVESDFVNLNEIIAVLTTSSDSTKETSYAPAFKYSVNLDLYVKSLEFLKFYGKKLKVSLSFNEKIINVHRAFAEAMGGELELKGTMSQQFNGDYYLKATTQTRHVNIDSLFYVFGNFKQSFITSEAIKGKLDAHIYAHMYFDHNWNFKRKLLYSEALLSVKDGELINFEPVMSLSAYLNEEGENLVKLKFSNLENHIIVSEDTVFISEMYVGTNVRNIKVGGYHTLNQHIDYRLAVPVVNDNKDKDEQFGKVKKDRKGYLYFPFRVYGTTSEYKVVYDLKTASSNLIKGVKKEIKGLGDIFIGKQKDEIPQDSLKLEDDEFFDWDNN